MRRGRLSVPGNSAQPGSPHYADLVPHWGEGDYFPLAFSREQVEANTKDRLVLQPLREFTAPTSARRRSAAFQPVQPELFDEGGAQTNLWADYDNDGKPDLFVGFRRGHLNRLYHNEGGGKFVDVAPQVGAGRRGGHTRRRLGRLQRRRPDGSLRRLRAQ